MQHIERKSQNMKRNLMTFEAPETMTEEVKKMAQDTYTSTSAVCRHALAHYLNQREPQTGDTITRY